MEPFSANCSGSKIQEVSGSALDSMDRDEMILIGVLFGITMWLVVWAFMTALRYQYIRTMNIGCLSPYKVESFAMTRLIVAPARLETPTKMDTVSENFPDEENNEQPDTSERDRNYRLVMAEMKDRLNQLPRNGHCPNF